MKRLKTIVALVIGTLLATALPAQAQTEYFTDSLNDLRYLADHTVVPAEVAYGTDVRRVKISFQHRPVANREPSCALEGVRLERPSHLGIKRGR